MCTQQDGNDKPDDFSLSYLKAADAMTKLEFAFREIGLTGTKDFDFAFGLIRTQFIRHGGETLRDMLKDATT